MVKAWYNWNFRFWWWCVFIEFLPQFLTWRAVGTSYTSQGQENYNSFDYYSCSLRLGTWIWWQKTLNIKSTFSTTCLILDILIHMLTIIFCEKKFLFIIIFIFFVIKKFLFLPYFLWYSYHIFCDTDILIHKQHWIP